MKHNELRCPICGSDKWRYVSYAENLGTVEQHGYCDKCGLIVEQSYSDTYNGFAFDRKRGYRNKYDGKYYPNNRRKRRRMRRKYNIKHTPNDWWLNRI